MCKVDNDEWCVRCYERAIYISGKYQIITDYCKRNHCDRRIEENGLEYCLRQHRLYILIPDDKKKVLLD